MKAATHLNIDATLPLSHGWARWNRGLRFPTLTHLLALFIAGQIGCAVGQTNKNDSTVKSATELARKIQETTGAKTPVVRVPPGEPCAVLPLSDVRKAFPGAKAGERSRRLEQYGATECTWNSAAGELVLVIQEWYSSGTVKQDLKGSADGVVEPRSAGNVRYETFNGIGSEAMAVVEQADPKRGILGDFAMLVTRRGERSIRLISGELPKRDRPAALKVLQELGRIAAKRLD